jgi:hypothetical protein
VLNHFRGIAIPASTSLASVAIGHRCLRDFTSGSSIFFASLDILVVTNPWPATCLASPNDSRLPLLASPARQQQEQQQEQPR